MLHFQQCWNLMKMETLCRRAFCWKIVEKLLKIIEIGEKLLKLLKIVENNWKAINQTTKSRWIVFCCNRFCNCLVYQKLKYMTLSRKLINFIFVFIFLSLPTQLAYSKNTPNSFADLAEKLMPSVVNISSTQTIKTSGNQFPFQFPFCFRWVS